MIALVYAANGDWTDALIERGVLGILFLLWVLGFIHTKFTVDRETKRADAAEERERLMHDRLEEKILPLLADVARELAEFTETRRRDR